MLNQQHALAKLRAEIERREGRICWGYRKFGYLVRNCRNREQEKKERSTLQNRFEVLASRVMRCGLRGEVKVKRQEVVEEVQYFRYRGTGHCKWECPNIAVEKEKRRQERAACPIEGKAQQWEKARKREPVCPNWEKCHNTAKNS